jgi:hypothetical protein
MLSISNHSLNLTTSNPTKTMESAKTNWLEWRSYLPRAISHTFLFKMGEGWSGSRGGRRGATPWEGARFGRKKGGGRKKGARRPPVSWVSRARPRGATPHWVAPHALARLTRHLSNAGARPADVAPESRQGMWRDSMRSRATRPGATKRATFCNFSWARVIFNKLD